MSAVCAWVYSLQASAVMRTDEPGGRGPSGHGIADAHQRLHTRLAQATGSSPDLQRPEACAPAARGHRRYRKGSMTGPSALLPSSGRDHVSVGAELSQRPAHEEGRRAAGRRHARCPTRSPCRAGKRRTYLYLAGWHPLTARARSSPRATHEASRARTRKGCQRALAQTRPLRSRKGGPGS